MPSILPGSSPQIPLKSSRLLPSVLHPPPSSFILLGCSWFSRLCISMWLCLLHRAMRSVVAFLATFKASSLFSLRYSGLSLDILLWALEGSVPWLMTVIAVLPFRVTSPFCLTLPMSPTSSVEQLCCVVSGVYETSISGVARPKSFQQFCLCLYPSTVHMMEHIKLSHIPDKQV